MGGLVPPQGLVPECYWVEFIVYLLGQRQFRKQTTMHYCENQVG
jgi:hypothetical protein